MRRILVINPGSTSTKIAVFEDRKPVFGLTLRHPVSEIDKFAHIIDQYEFRQKVILEALVNAGYKLKDFDAIVGRGGLIKPIPSGVYEVNEAMIHDLQIALSGEHACNLGGMIAVKIAERANMEGANGIKAYIADPVVVDELQDLARITGHPMYTRKSIFHALNQKAIAKRYAKETGRPYNSLNLIVAHMGGGISVGAHLKGRVIDVNNALQGEGPFSPDRMGGILVKDIVDTCYSGKFTKEEMMKFVSGRGGAVAMVGTNNFKEIRERADGGDGKCKMVLDAFVYNMAKQIGSTSAVLRGKVDAILLTGGIAYDKGVTDGITGYVSFIAPVKVYPGEDEMAALADNGFDVLEGEVKSEIYK
ncbi:MAG: butyrate kinase [Bacteroidales bacterium]|jgi:butyrate kinase|nr:butyrate kinase [Bacteroidales bacterium]MCI2122320.1 butyrate kinase [Bacteroidales bacterium]MCI2145354.1 butyrate kinase [Bacteroidales bacterium]